MTSPPELVEHVRKRANFACEYCGITEIDAGGLLTVDHFQPRSHDGTDDLANLIYSCLRCNWHKADYWPSQPGESMLWNPRTEPAGNHLLLLADGSLAALTPIGACTLIRVQLNREALVAHRRRKHNQAEETRLLDGYREMAKLLQEANDEQASLLRKQNAMLRKYQEVVALLRKKNQ